MVPCSNLACSLLSYLYSVANQGGGGIEAVHQRHQPHHLASTPLIKVTG